MEGNSILHEQLTAARKFGLEWPEVPIEISDNLAYELRDYQIEALGRFMHCFSKDFEGKELPLHLLFNMATGSGKTLVMAALVLYLYKQGHRNFLFFVNSNNIIQKTIENFTDDGAGKYLFADEISFDGKRINVQKVNNFEDADPNGINICFTTIQKMHSDLHNEKENALTFEDFRDKRIVLLSDESHHMQVATRQRGLDESLESPNWENTVEKIFTQNDGNLLLEFTATMDDFRHQAVREKYLNKVIYKYDLREFRNDGYSKDPSLFPTDVGKRERILQAIILSQYRQEVATANKIHLKPVVLFKAQKTIEQSRENLTLFNQLIDELKTTDINEIKRNCTQPVMVKAFVFFAEQGITNATLVRKLKDGFAPTRCLDVNEENLDKKSLKASERIELLSQQSILNSLEDKNNQYRAIFAVQKLNEGWDVLNLFDIVRMYEERQSGGKKLSQATISEAQLIGRGARYFPFVVGKEQEKYKRKYDKELDSDLRVLEELHYHSHYESRYIAEITTALREVGLMDGDEKEVLMKVKDDFKDKRFYKSGLVWRNERVETDFSSENILESLPSRKTNIKYRIYTGRGYEMSVFGQDREVLREEEAGAVQKDISLSEVESHVISAALQRYSFFDFSSLLQYFPKLKSKDDFISSTDYLAGFSITIEAGEETLKSLCNNQLFYAVCSLLESIEREIKTNIKTYRGSDEFIAEKFSTVFRDKPIKVKMGTAREDGQWDYLVDKDWYVFESFYGTTEEKAFVELVDRMISDLREKYQEIYLVRNERVLKLYNYDDGAAFEPDYLLFATGKEDKDTTFQVFVEPKGTHLLEHDKWKDEFLKQITKKNKGKTFSLANRKYKVIGVPFYNNESENEFKQNFINNMGL